MFLHSTSTSNSPLYKYPFKTSNNCILTDRILASLAYLLMMLLNTYQQQHNYIENKFSLLYILLCYWCFNLFLKPRLLPSPMNMNDGQHAMVSHSCFYIPISLSLCILLFSLLFCSSFYYAAIIFSFHPYKLNRELATSAPWYYQPMNL